MKNKNYFLFLGFILTILMLSSTIFAQEDIDDANIQYPVEELGNCRNKEACRVYCNQPEHLSACINFAEKHNLMNQEEIKRARKFITAGGKGPGGCKTKDSCEEYCNDVSHIDECIAFAEKADIIPREELAEAKKVQAAIKRGIKPPPCGNKRSCDIYCEDPAHMEECITFGEAAGFISGKELEDAKKMLQVIRKGIKPPPCRGKEACDIYCADATHFEECLTFAEAAGFISPEDAAMARKTGGKGPGNCRDKEECEAFCNKPENQEICFNFAREHNLIPEEDLKQMEEGRQRMMESLVNVPPEVLECLNSVIGSEKIEKLKTGSVMPSREIGEQMRQCFEKMMKPPTMPLGPEGQMPGGPTMAPPSGMMPSSQMMPPQGIPQGFSGPGGGCKTPEECMAYCMSNPQECRGFQPPSGPITPPAGPIAPPAGQMFPGQMPSVMPEGGQMPLVPPAGQMPPPSETQPSPETQPPTSQIKGALLLGQILNFFKFIFSR